MYIKRIVTAVIGILAISIHAQIPNNTWRDHLAYNQAHTVAITPNKVFCAMYSGGMLSYHKASGEIEKLSKVNGLSDINITAMVYSDEVDVLVVGYENGNIDLLTRDGIVELSDIKRKRITGSKRINKIISYQSRALVACDFGVVDIDLVKKQIKDSYFFGENGSNLKVNDLGVSGNLLYAATEEGLYKADLTSSFLVDYSYWNHLNSLPQADTNYLKVEGFGDEIIASYIDNLSQHERLIRIDSDDNWTEWKPVDDTVFYSISAYNNELSIVTKNNAFFYNKAFSLNEQIDLIYGRYALRDSDQTIYVAANFKGFLKYSPGIEEVHLYMNGPRFNTTGLVNAHDNFVWVGSGNRQNLYKNGAAHCFTDENWRSISQGYTAGLEGLGNFYKFAYHPANSNYIYGSALINGLYEIDNYQIAKVHNRETVPLFQQIMPSDVGVRFSGLDFDKEGKLWVVADEVIQPVFTLDESGNWEQLFFNSSFFFEGRETWKDLIVTTNNQIWILNSAKGICVIKVESDGSISEKSFDIRNQNGDLLTRAFCMVEDKDGSIWVGTNKGPIVYATNNKLFDDPDFSGSQIKLARNDGTNLADFLLDYETVNFIAVDGGNRKWLATQNSGLFLVSADGQETLHHFTEDNSPLPSNTIIGVDVQEKTGEVFISTNKGMVAFMGRATEGYQTFTDVYVYPNPVRPEYRGDITISGLIEDAYVKITDISGNVVFETTSYGGQAVWNGYNYAGDRVQTGVYLVFLTNADGSETQITKLVFVK